MGRVDSSGAEAKAQRMISELRLRIAERMPGVASELQSAVAARAPTHDEEFATLMIGDQPSGEVDLIPLAGDQSADPDDRIRFSKAPGTWILDTVISPANVRVLTDNPSMIQIAIGDLALHETNSVFTYKDEKVSTFSPVGPYFQAFEFGSVTSGWNETVVPRGTGAKGVPYPLRPDADPSHRPFSLFKPIFPRGMYNMSALESVARAALDAVMQEIGPSKI